jgi:hypothetical protein
MTGTNIRATAVIGRSGTRAAGAFLSPTSLRQQEHHGDHLAGRTDGVAAGDAG